MKLKAIVLSLLMVVVASTNSMVKASDIEKTISNTLEVTLSPPTGSVGIDLTCRKVNLACNYGIPTFDDESIRLIKLGVGYDVYTGFYDDFSISTVLYYNYTYDYIGNYKLIIPDNIPKFSVEFGMRMGIGELAVTSIHFDVLTKNIKLGLGFKF